MSYMYKKNRVHVLHLKEGILTYVLSYMKNLMDLLHYFSHTWDIAFENGILEY